MVKTINEQKVFAKKCPFCEKEITSLFEKQFKYNYEQHIKSHERKREIFDKSKEKIMQLVYEFAMDENIDKKERSFRKIGLKFGITNKTAQKYIQRYSEKIKEDK